MKTILLILLNLQLIYGTTFNSASSVYGRSRDIPTSEYRLGYTMPYGNGFNRNSTFGYPQNTYVNHKSTFGYTTGGSSGSGRPGQPRRVKGYDGNGKGIGDDSPEIGYSWRHGNWNFWDDEDNYDYYWDETPKTWWRKKKGSTNWEKWNEHTGHFIIDWWDYWDWDNNGKSGPTNPYVRGYHENPVPIDDPPFFVIIGLLFLWMAYDIIIKPLIKKDKN